MASKALNNLERCQLALSKDDGTIEYSDVIIISTFNKESLTQSIIRQKSLSNFIKACRRISDITGKPELYYPEWKRNAFRYFVTVPVIVFCLTVVFVSVFLILELQVKKYVPQKS